MKKQLLLIGALCGLAACTTELEEITDEVSGEVKEVRMSVPDFEWGQPQTRTVVNITDNGAQFTWAESDTVGIYPNEGSQVFFPVGEGAGSNTATFNGGGWALKSASTYSAYYPFVGKFYIDQTSFPVSYVGQCQTGNASTAHLGRFDWMSACSASPEQGVVNFSFKHLGCMLEINVPAVFVDEYTGISFEADAPVFVTEGTVDITAAKPAITPTKVSATFDMKLEGITTDKKDTPLKIYMMIAPIDFTERTVKMHLISKTAQVDFDWSLKMQLKAGACYRVNLMQNNNFAVDTPGTLEGLVGTQKYDLTKITVGGTLNQEDIDFLRDMAGVDKAGNVTEGKLTDINLMPVKSVSGANLTFANCPNLVNITLPLNATSIDKNMFTGCTALKEVKARNLITTIDAEAFKGCKALTTFDFTSLLKIGASAFEGCKALESVKCPNVTHLGEGAFRNCTKLYKADFPVVQDLGSYAFEGCTQLFIFIFSPATRVAGVGVFKNTSLSTVSLPSNFQNLDFASMLIGTISTINLALEEGWTEWDGNKIDNIPSGSVLKFEVISFPKSFKKVIKQIYLYDFYLKTVYIFSPSVISIDFGKGLKEIVGRNTEIYVPNNLLGSYYNLLPDNILQIKPM